MKKLVVGILAHVDAGKTTLSESMLFLSGRIRKPGRVDNKDAYLDTYELEKQRGITIFSKQAVFKFGGLEITLLDTPGHVDFSAEMERTLQVLDCAVLVISGADGVQGHTKTLWRLLCLYHIPVFLFVSKMDQRGTDKEKLIKELKERLGEGCIDFGQTGSDAFFDELAMRDEKMMDAYLEKGGIEVDLIKKAVAERRVFPCYFGSGLKLTGVEQLMRGIAEYSEIPSYPEEFGAKVFKISRDEQGNRLTFLKVTGGSLKVKDVLSDEEKVNQIRIYSGRKFEAVSEAQAGTVCAVTGPGALRPGDGLGIEKASGPPVLEPVLEYRLILPEDCDPRAMLPKLRELEEEEPELHVVWNEKLREIQVQLMGEVQTEILQSLIKSRTGIETKFGDGKIVYKETIAGTVEGVGHFEPLRHYAEVHLLLEPGEPGSGLRFLSGCSEDVLGRSWQRLILASLKEKVHKGVLTGSAITDITITLVSGRAHSEHTQGGDFREAACRAVRQGLMEAESVLLEPYYAFSLELPEKMVGKAMADVDLMRGTCDISGASGETAVLSGAAPVATMRNYQKEVAAYTKGAGKLFCSLKGYAPCHNAEEVIKHIGYAPDRDTENPSGSVFCTHGAGFLVDWSKVKEHMHLPGFFEAQKDIPDERAQGRAANAQERLISAEEIDRIIKNASFANEGKKSSYKKSGAPADSRYEPQTYVGQKKENKEEYLLVDGYNIIFSWPELAALADKNMDGARMKLLDLLGSYKGLSKFRIIVVFDAYRVQKHPEETMDFNGIHVVFTREAQTADQYIERFTHQNREKYGITVATSDRLQQIIVWGAGSLLLSARELKAEIERAETAVRREYCEKQETARRHIKDALPAQTRRQMEKFIKKEKN